MLKKDLLQKSQLIKIGNHSENIHAKGRFGAVLARAGVGKTALLVQLAINAMLQDKPVLHISLDHPVDKVKTWYRGVFQNLLRESGGPQEDQALWQSILSFRFIMTFKVEGFSVPKLEERLTDLMAQHIFTPQVIIVDGLPFDQTIENELSELKMLAQKNNLVFWFTIKTHRHESTTADGIPPQLLPVADYFDVAIQLEPTGDTIRVRNVLKPAAMSDQPELFLDPVTMLVKSE